jgi:hypothetical protein
MLAGLVGGIAILIRALLESDDPAPVSVAPTPPAPAPATDSEPTKESEPAPAAANGSRSREELYKDAQRLDIKGRSKMSKDELARAVADAERS